MHSAFCRLLLLFLPAWMSVALAQESKPLSVFPPEGFDFNGTWNCAGSFRNKAGPQSHFYRHVILGSKWLGTHRARCRTSTGYLAKYLIGYDPRQKRITLAP